MALKRWPQPTTHVLAGVLLSLPLLGGCASSLALTRPARESVRSVSVSREVKLPDDMYYAGPGQSAGMLFGPVGALIAAAAARGPKGQLKAAMQARQIDLGQIVREQFEAGLTAAGIFPSVVETGGDAEVRLEVCIFGFARPPGFSGGLKPMLGVTGYLARSDGTVLWKRYEYVTNLSDKTRAHSLEEYLRDPELIREAFEVASRLVAGDRLKDLRR